MIAFAVIMRAELGQGPGQRAFPEQNQLRQTLLLGGPNPTFRKGVQIRTSGGKGHGLYTACRQHRPKRWAELRVTIVQNITASIQISPALLGRAAGDLFHPLLIRMSGDSRHTGDFPNEGRTTHSRSPNPASSVLPR